MAVIQLHPRQLPIFEITGSGLYLSASQIIVGAGEGIGVSGSQVRVNQGPGITVSGSTVGLLTPGTISSSSVNSALNSHTHALNIFNAVLPVTIVPDATGSGGSSVMAARLDHTHPILAGTPFSVSASATNYEGSSTSFARADHTHFVNAFNPENPMAIVPDASGNSGSIAMAARIDHVHAITAAVAIGLSGSSTNAEGGTSYFSRSDHTHQIACYSDVSLPISAIIKSDTSGDIKLHKLEATDRITVPLINTNAGISLSIAPDQDLNLSPSGSRVRLTSPVRIQSDHYVSQTTGWGISYAGGGDFRYLYTDELHARAFIVDLEAVRAGIHGVFPSASVLATDFMVPAAGASSTLVVETFKGFNSYRVFLDNDIVNIRNFSRSGCSLTIADCYGAVTWVSTDLTNKTQTYTFVRSASPNSGMATSGSTILAGATVPDYGISGNGYLESNAIDGYRGENSPYNQTVTWVNHPATGKTVNTRLGNLYGIFASSGEYGLYAGSGVTDASSYLRISNQFIEGHNLPIRLYSSASRVIAIEPNSSNPYIAIGYPIPTDFANQNGVWAGRSSGVYKMHVGSVSAGSLVKGWAWDGDNLVINGNLTVGDGNLNYGITLNNVLLLSRFDGPTPYATDYTGTATSLQGDAATLSGGVIFRPGKFGKGAQFAEATINQHPNPSGETNASYYGQVIGTETIARITTDAYIGLSCINVACTGGSNSEGVLLTGSVAGGLMAASASAANTFSAYLRASVPVSLILLIQWYTDAGTYISETYVTKAVTTEWERYAITATAPATATKARVQIRKPIAHGSSWYFKVDAVQFENKDYETSYCDGSLGTGHSWNGTAHASTSSRTATVLSYPVSGNIDFNQGSVGFWIYWNSSAATFKRMFYAYYDADNYISILSDATNGLYAYGEWQGTLWSSSGGALPMSSGWHHVVMTWAVGGNVVVYLDGVASSALPVYPDIDSTLLPTTFYVGGTNSSAQVNTVMDEFFILDRALDADSVRAIYYSSTPITINSNTSNLYLRDNSVSGYVMGNAQGIFGYSSISGSEGSGAFALVTSTVTLGTPFGGSSITLDTGDLLIGSVSVNKNNFLYDHSAGTLSLRNNTTNLINLNAIGNITVGNISTEHIFIDSGSVQIKDGANVYTNLVGGILTLGLVSGGEYVTVDGTNGIKLYGSGSPNIQLSNAGLVTVGDSSYNHLLMSSSAVYIKSGSNIHTNLTSGSLFLGLQSSGEYISIDPNNGLRMYGNNQLTVQLLNTGILSLGDTSNDHLLVSPSAIYIKAGNDIYTNLTSGSLILGLASSGEYISIDPNNGLRLYGGGSLNGQWLNNGDITLGSVAANKSNLFWDVSEGRLNFRGGSSGDFTQIYVDTEGTIKAGDITISSAGMLVDNGADSLTSTVLKFITSSYAPFYGQIIGYGTTPGAYSRMIMQCNNTTGNNSSNLSLVNYAGGHGIASLSINNTDHDDLYFTMANEVALAGHGGSGEGLLFSVGNNPAWSIIENTGSYTATIYGDQIAYEDQRVGKGLHVGAIDYSPYDNDITVDGGISAGWAGDPGVGNFYYTGSLVSFKNSTEYVGYIFVPLTVPLTSTSWDGDSFSTTAKTKIDLSAVFSTPAKIKAVKVYVGVRDSDSAGTDTYLILGPTDTADLGIPFSPLPVNDRWYRGGDDIPCDSNGDIYYQIAASGAGTFDVVLQIWGYYI